MAAAGDLVMGGKRSVIGSLARFEGLGRGVRLQRGAEQSRRFTDEAVRMCLSEAWGA